MEKKIRILILEAAAAEVESMEHELHKTGFPFSTRRVETKEEFMEGLEDFAPDLILANYKLPSFDGLAALTIAKDKCPNIPFIFVAGKVGEELAVETLKMGATDYVLKDRLLRLCPSIIRALREADERITDKKAEETLWQSEERFRQAAENNSEWIWEVDANGLYTYSNPVVERILGYTPEEIVGKKYFYDLYAPEVREKVKKTAFKLSSRGKSFKNFVNLNVNKDGTIVILETNATPIVDNSGKLLGYRGVDTDVTERRRMEEALHESKEKYEAILENIEEGFFEVDLAGNFTLVNDSLCRMLGYPKDELMGMNNKQYMDKEAAKKVYQLFNQVYITGKPCKIFDWEITRRDGVKKFHESSVSLIRNAQGEPIGFRGIARDITERKRMEEALLESEERYRNIFNNAQIGLFRSRIGDGLILEANLRAAQIQGFNTRAESIGNYITSEHYIDPGTRKRFVVELQKNGEVNNFEARLSRKDGSIYWARLSARIYPEKGYVEGILADITEEKLAEEKLRNSEQRYRLLVENAPLGILSVDLQGQIIDANPVLLSMIGSPSEQATCSINIFTFPPLVEAGISSHFHLCLESEKTAAYESRYTSKRGKELYVRYHLAPIQSENGQVIGVQAIFEDISEKKKLEEQLIQSQKMEAIGTLAGGIAHDFNNILSAIIGYTELASLDLPEGADVQEKLQAVLKSSHRARDLVKHILTFSRRGEQERKPVQIGSVVKETLKLLRASLQSTIEIRENVESNTGIINANLTQIHQVVMNLCTNAAQALNGNGGVLEVSLTHVDMDAIMVRQYPELYPGFYVQLIVSDNGHGMTSQVLERIFDPYFTTKKVGEGTGLGLAVVHGIVKSHGGAIRVYSEPGKGSSFRIYFPIIDSLRGVTDAQRSEPLPLGGHERILFVDDEQALVDLGKRMLEHLGYEVVARTSSIEALEAFRAQRDRFDLVITDMTMPNMTGDKLAHELLRLRPGIPIILCTGFSERLTGETAKSLGVREYVMKPFNMNDLASVIRKALEKGKKIKGVKP